ncbi:hypothetical protein K5X82_12390 [Halosquirtibacter xylanolyticus]|uniref:hypothetical protein n=1 Tax=Halosquirtibacter xylanolyticus TaxID=3374599 RepID=UPI0037490F76|nr:hypothetical protein K5X82_12390 [Prolixibacteraceae bacterium]
MNFKHIIFMSAFLSCFISLGQTESTKDKEKGDGEDRNIMLNASDSNKPREIQIGLPSEDVCVYENGLPVVYSSSLHNVSTHWRSDVSLGKMGVMNPTESAILTGNIAYSVDSYTELGTKEFKGKLHYLVNHYGQQQFDLNLSGQLYNNWVYSGSVYQNFDPGAFDLKFTDYQDRTQIYKFGLTKLFNNNKGHLSFIYHYSKSKPVANAAAEASFIYKGDGEVEEIPGLSLGTTSYLSSDGKIEYVDVRNGKLIQGQYDDFCNTEANEGTVMLDYNFDSGIKWSTRAKYMMADAAFYAVGGTAISQVKNGQEVGTSGSAVTFYQGNEKYTGQKQGRIGYSHDGTVKNLLATTELSYNGDVHDIRLGINEWYYDVDYASSTTRYDQVVSPHPEMLTRNLSSGNSQVFYDYNLGGSEYYKGYENKLALYFSDTWKPNNRLSWYYGMRGEYYRVAGENLPYSRVNGFHIGQEVDGKIIKPKNFEGNYFNYAIATSIQYRLSRSLSALGDFTYATRRPAIQDYAGTSNPNDQQIKISLVRGGLFYHNNWMNITSMLSCIQKSNNYKRLNINNPAPGSTEVQAAAFNYDIRTVGWTTNIEADPTKWFHLHFLLTLQNPTYQKYESTVHFNDGTEGHINATDNFVTEIPRTLIEIDPSFNIGKKMSLWSSFRYYGKTYANLSNALYFNSHWETFAGIKYQANKNVALNMNVVNFLDQTGAKGTISGSELIKKDEAYKYNNHWMYGRYMRPMTYELSVVVNF